MTHPAENEARYTLAEARAEMERRECAAHGHSWETLATFDGFPIRIVCESCGWSGSVTMDKAAASAGDCDCDCDYWDTKHRWHCAPNHPASVIPPASSEREAGK